MVGSLLTRSAAVLLGVATLACAACADDAAGGAVPRDASPTVRSTATEGVSTPSPAQPPGPVATALARAASDAGVSADAVELLEFRAENWPTAALGCPEPGKFYAQVITPGYIVRLRVAGVVREYHTDLAGRVVHCDKAQG